MFLRFRFKDDQFFYGSCILVQPLMQRHKKSQTKYSPYDKLPNDYSPNHGDLNKLKTLCYIGYALLWPKNCVLLAQECMLSMLKEFGKSMIIRLVNFCSVIFHFGHLSRRHWCISAKAEHKKAIQGDSQHLSSKTKYCKIWQITPRWYFLKTSGDVLNCFGLVEGLGLVYQVCWSSFHAPDLILFGFLGKSPIVRSINDYNVESWIWSVVTLVGEENPRLRYELSG